jgi:hypothetical protein
MNRMSVQQGESLDVFGLRAVIASNASANPEFRSQSIVMFFSGGPVQTVHMTEAGCAASNRPQLSTASSRCGETTSSRSCDSIMLS